MSKGFTRVVAVLAFTLVIFGTTAQAGVASIHRGLRRMAGFTIVSSDSISEINERKGEKYITLLSGAVFKANFLLLDPLPASDVIVSAKRIPDSIRKRYPNLAEALQYEYRLLVDDEVIEVTPAK